MKIAIMQPYLFPYIGYWQLINAADCFVILDDVNYIMRGYIARNSILLGGKEHRFSVPVHHASQNKLIMDTKLNFTPEDKNKFMETLRLAYGKAPFYKQGEELIRGIIMNGTNDLTGYIENSILRICGYLGIERPVMRSSHIAKDNSLKGQERIIALCKALNADTYINPPGGRDLYSRERFSEESIELLFLDPAMDKITYRQFDNEFVSYLSIIDFIMFNDIREIRKFLDMYSLNEI